MINFVVELQSVLFGIVVTAIVSLLMAVFRHWRLRRRDRAFWDRRSDKVSVLLATSRTDTGTYNRPVTGLGQARAMGLITPHLTRSYRGPEAVSVDLSAFRSGVGLEGDLILLGGPKNNGITEEALKRLSQDFDLPVTMKTNGDECLYARQHGIDVPYPPASEPPPDEGVAGADYGLIIRAHNCFDPRGTITILAGTHTYGTIAAVRYLLENEREIRKLGDRFAIVVKSFVTAEEHVERPRLEIGPEAF